MKAQDDKKDKVQWETIEALETIANQCIYKGKEVSRARALLKALYKEDIIYDDDANCSTDESSSEDVA